MKINRIKLNPFGGVIDEEINFKDGMNVIVGENEKGKSTILNAILKVLFTRTDLTASKFKKQLERFIPIGGDFAYVEIDFAVSGKHYKLKRKWGSSEISELTLDDGIKISNEDNVEEKLKEILPFNEATFEKVLLTQQNSLSKTVDELESSEDSTVRIDFNNILRSSIIDSGSVSIDEFQNKLDEKFSESLGRWEIDNNRPEGGRGIENPWKQGVGLILESYYELEEQKKELKELTAIEEKLENLRKEESELNTKVERLNKYISDNKEIEEDAKKRTTSEAKLSAAEANVQKLKDINGKWPVIEDKLNSLPALIVGINQELERLDKEKAERKKIDDNKDLLEKFKRLNGLKQIYNEAKNQLDKTKKITDADIEKIEKVKNNLESTKTKIESSKLSVSIQAKKETRFNAQLGVQSQEEIRLSRDEQWLKKADGRFNYETEEVKISVAAGDIDFDALKSKFDNLYSEYEKLLFEFKAKDFEELRNHYKIYQMALNDYQNTENNYTQELGEDNYEKLTQVVEEINSSKNAGEIRSLESIIVDLTEKGRKLKDFQKEKDTLEEELKKITEEYETKDNLFLKLGEEIKLINDLKNGLTSFKPIPKEYSNADDFIYSYENKIQELYELKEELSNVRISISGLEPLMKDSSSQELNEIISEKKEEFERHLKIGNRLIKIIEKAQSMKNEIDENIYDLYNKDFLSHISALSGDKYQNAKMEESIPTALISTDGKEISNDLLSVGTKDILGISVHLVMIKYYLNDLDGFIGIDDPLVDLDPVRQKAASDLLVNFAKEKQTIIFTCHPSHADQLGGNRIEL